MVVGLRRFGLFFSSFCQPGAYLCQLNHLVLGGRVFYRFRQLYAVQGQTAVTSGAIHWLPLLRD